MIDKILRENDRKFLTNFNYNGEIPCLVLKNADPVQWSAISNAVKFIGGHCKIELPNRRVVDNKDDKYLVFTVNSYDEYQNWVAASGRTMRYIARKFSKDFYENMDIRYIDYFGRLLPVGRLALAGFKINEESEEKIKSKLDYMLKYCLERNYKLLEFRNDDLVRLYIEQKGFINESRDKIRLKRDLLDMLKEDENINGFTILDDAGKPVLDYQVKRISSNVYKVNTVTEEDVLDRGFCKAAEREKTDLERCNS